MGIFGYILLPLALLAVCVIGWASGRRKRVARRIIVAHQLEENFQRVKVFKYLKLKGLSAEHAAWRVKGIMTAYTFGLADVDPLEALETMKTRREEKMASLGLASNASHEEIQDAIAAQRQRGLEKLGLPPDATDDDLLKAESEALARDPEKYMRENEPVPSV